jgi:sec-independent protein translocase protein TatA
MDISPVHILIILLIILLLFGGKKIPEMMRGLGQGVREFKEGMRDSTATPPAHTETPVQSQQTQERK